MGRQDAEEEGGGGAGRVRAVGGSCGAVVACRATSPPLHSLSWSFCGVLFDVLKLSHSALCFRPFILDSYWLRLSPLKLTGTRTIDLSSPTAASRRLSFKGS